MVSVDPILLYPIVIALPLFLVLYVLLFKVRQWQVRQGTIEFDYPEFDWASERAEPEQTEERPEQPSGLRARIARGVYPYYRRN